MNFIDMFTTMGNTFPTEENPNSSTYEPTYVEYPQNGSVFESEFQSFKSTPALYNMDGYISPYASNNWGSISPILQNISDQSRFPALETKIDPNRIFSSDITALRALASDQQKITKLFEKRLMESLTDKGKFGLNESDVEAMQALTAARSAITNINKEQVNIKKNIADIRLKQQQSIAKDSSGGTNVGSRSSYNVNDIGRSVLDNIFDAPADNPNNYLNMNYVNTDSYDAARMLDDIIPTSSNQQLQYERMGVRQYVLLGDTDDDIDYVAYDSDGNMVPDYPKPDSRITSIDRSSGKAIDDRMVEYEIKFK